jgi:GcrA cell cycle regulator
MNSETWTPENVALLRTLWADGWTGSRIAERIPGTTRSAIIGKVHRLQLPPRAVSFRKRTKVDKPKLHASHLDRRVTQRHKPKTKARLSLESAGLFCEEFDGQFENLGMRYLNGSSPTKAIDPKPEDIARVSIVDLEPHHCKWPCSEQRGIDTLVYCGGDRLDGLPYCKDHALRAYRPERPSKGLFRLSALDFDATRNPRFVDNRELEQTTP